MARDRNQLLTRRVRVLLVGFMIGLFISGITAFPLPREVSMLADWVGARDGGNSTLTHWIAYVSSGLEATQASYPFLFYGTDWLAFGHLVIGLLFIGPARDPLRNVWVIQWGILACVLVIPLALICGPIRGIPFFWRLIDCSFGVVGVVPLLVCLRDIRELQNNS